MVSEILIVGDEPWRAGLTERVRTLGYDATSCAPDQLVSRLSDGPTPAAIVVRAGTDDAAALMVELRRTSRGAALPVTLCGHLGDTEADLADVLDLGADHFLEEPVSDEQLAAALANLAGAPEQRSTDVSLGADPVSDDAPAGIPKAAHAPTIEGSHPTPWPVRTEVIEAPLDPGDGRLGTAVERNGQGRPADSAIGQLHRTLDILGHKLQQPDVPHPGDSADDFDLSMMGIEAVPDVDADEELLDPGASHDRMELQRVQGRGRTEARAGSLAVSRVGSRESTVLIDEASSEVRGSENTVSAAFRVPSFEDDQPSTARMIHDRPRRTPPLPVDREGSLAVIEVPRLLWKLHRAHFSGDLTLTHGEVHKTLWFDAGNVVFARSSLGHDRLIDGLLRQGLLTRGQYDTARRLAAKEPGRAGRLLVESGFLKADELPQVLRNHFMRIVDSTFPWNDGTWGLDAGGSCDEAVQLDRPTSLVLMDGIRNRMEATQLWALLGGPRQYPHLRELAAQRRLALIKELRLSPAEQGSLPALDGSRSLEALTSERGVDELEFLGLVYGLHVLELVDLLGEPRPDAGTKHDPDAIDRERISDRLRLVRVADYFQALGVPRTATRVDVRRAHAALLQTFSDEALGETVRDTMAPQLRELRYALSEAARVLSDDALRTTYLAHLEPP